MPTVRPADHARPPVGSPSGDPARPPGLRQRIGEARAAVEPLRLLATAPSLARRRALTPRTVIVIPGLGAGDRSMAPLRAFLDRLGHRSVAWGLGRMTPDVEATLERFLPRVVEAVDRADEPVALVGWSLGGIVARETAREVNGEWPGAVGRVVTFGSPIEGPRNTSAGRVYTPEQLDRIEAIVEERRGRSLGCDLVAIHSRNDGVVGWRTVVDLDAPGATNVEVRSAHFGMGIDPDVWTAVADALDRPLVSARCDGATNRRRRRRWPRRSASPARP